MYSDRNMPISIQLPRTSEFFTIRKLKIALALSCVWSTAYFTIGVLHLDLPRNWWWSSNIHTRSAVTECFLSTLFCGAALYGIHKRTVTAWRLGWVYLGAGYILWLLQCRTLTHTVPEADSPQVAVAAAAIGGALVAVYWGLWWKRQRGYFKTNIQNNAQNNR